MSDTTATGTTPGISSQQMQQQMEQLQDEQNANMLSMYQYSSKASFANSLASTYGGLAMDSAKNKPQV